MYRKLKDIREEYNVYKSLNIQHINMYSEYFKQVLAYEEEKKQKDIYKKIEKLETVRDDLRNYKKYIEGKRSDFETTIVDGLDKYVKKYSKSIIKYNTV
jgi:hypothetical protein